MQYINIDFHSQNLRLSASRSKFYKDKYFYEIKNELEKEIIKSFKDYLNKIKNSFEGDIRKIRDITDAFFSHFCSISWFNIWTEDLSDNVLDFIKDYYLFRCISDREYTYLSANIILNKEFKLIGEPIWSFGNDEYLKELSKSEDFLKDINYVIINRDDLLVHDIERENPILERIFGTDKIIPISKFIRFEELEDMQGLLGEEWSLVKFLNYKSDNIIEEYFEKRVINSDFPFIRLIINNLNFFHCPDNKLYLNQLFSTFHRNHYPNFNEAREWQTTILNRMKDQGLINETDIGKYLLTKENFPPQYDYSRDFV